MDISKDEIASRSFNDDFYAAFSDDIIMEEYWNIEEEIFEEYSMIRAPEKSFRGTDFVLCESYSGPLNDKESYLRREILMALA